MLKDRIWLIITLFFIEIIVDNPYTARKNLMLITFINFNKTIRVIICN